MTVPQVLRKRRTIHFPPNFSFHTQKVPLVLQGSPIEGKSSALYCCFAHSPAEWSATLCQWYTRPGARFIRRRRARKKPRMTRHGRVRESRWMTSFLARGIHSLVSGVPLPLVKRNPLGVPIVKKAPARSNRSGRGRLWTWYVPTSSRWKPIGHTSIGVSRQLPYSVRLA